MFFFNQRNITMRFQYAINMNARGFHASSALDEMISTHFSSWLSFLLLLLLLLFSTDRISSVGAFSLTSPFTEFFFFFCFLDDSAGRTPSIKSFYSFWFRVWGFSLHSHSSAGRQPMRKLHCRPTAVAPR